MPGDQAQDEGLSLQKENKRAMLECVDRFHSVLEKRSKAIKDIADIFEAVQVKSLLSASTEDLQASVQKLTFYDELSEIELLSEIPRLRRHLKAAKIDLNKYVSWSPLDFLQFIVEWNFIESLPNLTLSLKLFLTICVSVATCERRFSKLKIIKNYLRSTMGQCRLSDLAISSIECELARNTDFHQVRDEFATMNTRKVSL